jgi:hypothetical protein
MLNELNAPSIDSKPDIRLAVNQLLAYPEGLRFDVVRRESSQLSRAQHHGELGGAPDLILRAGSASLCAGLYGQAITQLAPRLQNGSRRSLALRCEQ